MKFFGLGIAAALLVASAPVMAVELVIDDEAIEMATSHWDGFYAGIGGVAYAATISRGVGAAGILGANMTIGEHFLIGGEVYGGSSLDDPLGPFFVLGGEARGGFIVTDEVLVYGAAGLEGDSFGARFATLGGGVEFAATDELSIDIEYKHQIGLNTATRLNQIGASLNFHF